MGTAAVAVIGNGMEGTGMGGTDAAAAATATRGCAGAGEAGTERGGMGAVAAAEKMLLSATAAFAAAAGVGTGAPLLLSRCLTRVIKSCGWKGLRSSSSAFTANAFSATARFTTPDIRITGVLPSSGLFLICEHTS